MIEKIEHQGLLLAIVISRGYNKPGISFVTPDELSQQLAYMNHPKGKIIQPHIHHAVTREVEYTQETLVIKRGKIRVDFYSEQKEFLFSRTLLAGDAILLVRGGHGFEVLEDLEMYEIKQGPFVGDHDKLRFDPQ